MSPGLSPFLVKPKRILPNDDHSEYNLQQVISNLQFQLASEKTEKQLLQQNKDSVSQEYEAVIHEKNQQVSSLQQDVQFLYKQREQLESKLKNQSDIHSTQHQKLEQELSLLKQSNRELVSKCDRLEVKLQKATSNLQYTQTKLNVEKDKTVQLTSRAQELEAARDDLTKLTQSLSNQLTEVSEYLKNDKSVALQDQNDILLKSNSQLQLKIDELLQNKTSNELLKQQNISLLNKIDRLEDFEQKYWNLSIENSKLKTKFDDYFKLINQSVTHEKSETNESIVIKFVNKFKELKNSNLVLFDKYSASECKLNETESRVNDLQSQVSTLNSDLLSYKNLLIDKDQRIKKLENQKLLNIKEIDFLRNSLKKFDSIGKNNSKEETSEATNQYLSNLEKLVDGYKAEIENLKKEKPSSLSIGEKRPRIIDDAFRPNDYQQPDSRLLALESDNVKLLTTIKNLEDEIIRLNDKISGLETIKAKEKEFHILQLKSNPFTNDQAIKAKSLDVLREENKDLIAKYVTHSDSVDVIPKSVFARQEHENALLQTKIDQLTKKTNRLKAIYTDKSKEILSIISRYFGYSIEFIPSPMNSNDLSSRIKLVSKYVSEDHNNGFLVLDLNSKSLKAHGTLEFKNLCEELVLKWVDDKGQIPCFLSALNLKLYNYTI